MISFIPPFLQAYSAIEWPLFPCRNRDDEHYKAKTPYTHHGFKDASLEPSQIASWHQQYPDCAWGTPTSSIRGIIDIDPRHGGDTAWQSLIAKNGELPRTPTVQTGGIGFHYWLQFPEGTRSSKNLIGQGIDIKADGGYAIIPPSKIEIPEHNGRKYGWTIPPWEADIAKAPDWLAELLQKPEPKTNRQSQSQKPANENADPWIVQTDYTLESHPGSPEGQRRITLCKLVGSAIAQGVAPETIWQQAEAWASRCNPPFDEWERHVGRLWEKEKPEPSQSVGYLASLPEEKTELDNDKGELCVVKQEPSTPLLRTEAFHGLFGEMLKAITPETEADPSGILVTWLTVFGNIIGRGAWVEVGARKHYPQVYTCVVGKTSDAKGDSWGIGLYPFRQIEPLWASMCIANGVGSGEGLIERIADEQLTTDRKGNALTIPGASDKRCLLRLSEMSRCFKVGRREASTLSEMLREAWDGEPIHVPNRKGNNLSTTGYTISVVGDITPGVIQQTIQKGTEAFDGFANRFLWCSVHSPQSLPSGGNASVLDAFSERLKAVISFVKKAGRITRDDEAEALWNQVYGVLKTSGDTAPHTDRARPYVVRLAMLYALADGVSVIGINHLRAALAVWDYCRKSAALIFGLSQTPQAEPDPLWLRALNAITETPGISRSDLLLKLKHVAKADDLDKALAYLASNALAYPVMVQNPKGGPKGEHWYPGKPEPKPDGEAIGSNHYNTPSPLPSPDPWVVQPEAKESNQLTPEANGQGLVGFLPKLAESPPEPSPLGEPFPVEARTLPRTVSNQRTPEADGQGLVGYLPDSGETPKEETISPIKVRNQLTADSPLASGGGLVGYLAKPEADPPKAETNSDGTGGVVCCNPKSLSDVEWSKTLSKEEWIEAFLAELETMSASLITNNCPSV